MTRAVVFLLATFVAWPQLGAQANSSSPARQTAASEQTATDNSAQRTVIVTGCLDQSEAGGAFTLTDTSGREFVLAANTDSLVDHTQQQVQVTGQQSFSSEPETKTLTSAQGHRFESEAGAAANQPVIEVAETKIISDHCSSPAAASEKPSAEASDPAGGQYSRNSSQSANGPHLVRTDARVDEAAQEGAHELPQTSTILPLLGLIGLGSLVAGFFARR